MTAIILTPVVQLAFGLGNPISAQWLAIEACSQASFHGGQRNVRAKGFVFIDRPHRRSGNGSGAGVDGRRASKAVAGPANEKGLTAASGSATDCSRRRTTRRRRRAAAASRHCRPVSPSLRARIGGTTTTTRAGLMVVAPSITAAASLTIAASPTMAADIMADTTQEPLRPRRRLRYPDAPLRESTP